MTMKFHPKCRPPRGAVGYNVIGEHDADRHPVIRFSDRRGRWPNDDGKPAAAFIGSLDGANIVWVARCSCKDAKCPRWKALEYVREVLGLESVVVHERPKAR